MDTEILDALDDATRWHSVLSRLPAQCRDSYFCPEYVRLHLFEAGSRALLFTYQQGKNAWVYPFILRPISRVGEEVLTSNWCDIESAYGYGGPISTTDARDFIETANGAFAVWCNRQGIVAEFIRLHPLLAQEKWLSGDVEVVYDRETVSLDLNRLDACECLFSKATLNMLRRARRLEVRVAAYATSDRFDQFRQLYLGTIKRNRADAYYYFNDIYFRRLQQLVLEAGWLYAATLGDAWISASVFLKGQSWMHYHLSGSAPDRVPGANNLVLFTAAHAGRNAGVERLHLGGGRTADPGDSLLDFKRSMATDSHHFYIGKRIHNPEAYAQLRELWAKRYPLLVPRYGSRLLCYRYAPTESAAYMNK